jgi:hypothetical protein
VRLAFPALGEPFELFNSFPGQWSQTMMNASLLSAALASSRRSGFQRDVFLLLFSGCALATAAAQAGLPRDMVSVPALGSDQGPNTSSNISLNASLKAANRCGEDSPIVLPKVVFQFGAEGNSGQQFAEQAEAVQNLPAGAQVWLYVSVIPEALTGKETEKQLTEQVNDFLKQAPLSAPAVRGLIIEPSTPRTASNLYVFALLRLAVAARSANPALRLAFAFPSGFIGQYGESVKRLAMYSDLLGISDTPVWRADATWIAEHALNKPLILKLESSSDATASYLSEALGISDTAVEMLWSTPLDTSVANQLCATNSFLTHSLPANLFRLNGKTLPFTLTVDGASSDEAGWFSSGQSGDTVVLMPVHGLPDHSRTVVLQARTKAQYEIEWFDAETGSRIPTSEPMKSDAGLTSTCACGNQFVLIDIHKKSSTETTVYNQVEVKSGVDLSVEEIIARWQQNREAQKRRLDNYQASSFMNLHFESTSVAQAFDISMRLRQFSERGGKMELEQTEFYVNGVKFSHKHEFPLPQLEPGKVLSQPLELTLNERYSYKLLGTEQINGAQCYVVGVEPKAQDENLYSGKIWIDGVSFREVRQSLSQHGVKSNVVVNVETQNFALVNDGQGNQFNLLSSISAQQTLNAAGRDFLLQRTLQFSDYAINTPRYAEDLTAAHRSDAPMYRETDQGLRELKIKGGERVLQPISQKRIVSLVGGAMYQGTYNFPIPIAGISMADFDYRHTGAQLSVFFAGPLLATDLSKQYGTKYRLAADLALNALPGENRIYNGNKESIQQSIWTWEQTLGARASWQATNHFSATAFTYLAYDIFRRTSDTSNQYALPRNGVALLPGVQLRLTEKGYIFTADGTRGERLDWKQFGCTTLPSICAAQPLPSKLPLLQSGYTLYDADLNKDYYIRKFTKGGWDVAYYGGDQLDRFSRYFPSFFSTPRIHGIPGGTDSFDAIAMGNVHYGFNVMDLMKFEGMYSYARARNLDETSHFRKFDGLETNFNTAGPKGTLIQGTVSYALNGNIDRYNSRWGMTVMIFKPF